jgi:orotidine-5'-phosphate decarboxylase
MAAADHVNRYGSNSIGKFGYTQVGVMAGASSAQGLQMIRQKYPNLFLLVDGLDYPNANAKNCSLAFDRFGHGAAICVATSVTCAWKSEEGQSEDFLLHAVASLERQKKNISRYITIL